MTTFCWDVLGQVDDDRSGAARLGDVEGFLDDPRDVLRVQDEVAVLDDRQRHPEYVRLLERRLADHGSRDLARDGDQRTLSMKASAMQVTRLVAPGPLVDMHTPPCRWCVHNRGP
jgi:hypothetical protein